MFSGSMAFVWGSAFGNPPLALDNPLPYFGRRPHPNTGSHAGAWGGFSGQPDLYISEFSFNPTTPTQGQAVEVRIGVYNQGNAAVSGPASASNGGRGTTIQPGL